MIVTLILIMVYVFSIVGAIKLLAMDKEKVNETDKEWVMVVYFPIINTFMSAGYLFLLLVEFTKNLINTDIDNIVKEDFKKKVEEQHPNTILQAPQYDRMSKIELDLAKFKIPNEAWLLIYEWEKLKYEEGVYVGNVFPQEAKMNNPIQCKNLFESIKDTAEKLTSGNVAHHKNEIIHLAQRGIENIE